MKKVASIVLSIILAMNLVLPVNAGPSDFGMMDANRTAILARWMDAGVIKGYEDGSFQPDKEITRAEMVQVLANLFRFQSGSGTSEFTDVDSSRWYFSAVDHAYGQQIVQGYPDGTFRGDGKISKEDAVVMLYKAFRMTAEGEVESQFSDAQKVSDYARTAVVYFEKMGYISGDSEGRFLPKDKLSRIELMEIIDAIVDLYVNEDDSIIENVAAESLLIVAKNVKIKNVQIGKSLFIADSVGDSDVHFEELSVQGTSYLSGGGSNSIHLMNSELGFVVVDKRSGETLRVFLEGETSVDSLEIKSSVILEDTTDGDGHGILKLRLSKDLDKESILKLIGSFPEVESEADGIDIQLEGFISFLKNNGIEVKLNGISLKAGENNSLGDIDLSDEDIATNQPNGNNDGNAGNGNGNNNGNINNEKMWTLSWSDEFNGNTIDASKWTYDIGNWIVDGSGNGVAAGWGNNEKEYYTDSSDNSYVKAGKLVIEAKKEETTDQFGTYAYTSAKLKTKGIFSQTYGRYEVKAKFPVGKGLWPAIWMLPESDVYGGWAASGEIDIVEGWGSKADTICGTLHYGGLWPGNKYSGKNYVFPNTTSVNEFHEYALEWEPGEIRWYVDGVLYQTQNNWYTKDANGEKYAFPAPFDQDFYLIMNLAVGGNFDGEPTAETLFPSKMEVDYVRVYELTGRDYKSPVEPSASVEPLPEGAKVATADGNLLSNGSFADEIQDNFDGSLTFGDAWNLVAISDFGGSASQSIEALNGENFAKVDIQNGGNQSYSVQLIQNTTVGKGRYYKVSFDAKSTTKRNINMKVGGGADVGYVVYSDNYTLALTDSLQHFEKVFQMQGETNLNTRLEFNLGLDTNSVWIGNVRLEEVPAPVKDYNATKTPLADGNGIYNGAFDKESLDRMAYWNFESTTLGAASASVAESSRELCVTISQGGLQPEEITVDQRGLILEKGSDYHLSFMARASESRNLRVEILSEDGSVQYVSPTVFSLDGTMTLQELDFTVSEETSNQGKLAFEFGGNVGKVYIDEVRLTQTSVDYSNIDVYPIENGDFSNGLASWSNYVDWSAGAIITADGGAAKIAVDHVGTETWGIQLYQGTFVASNKVEYIVSFDVKSSVDRNLEVIIDNASYNRYLNKTVSATTDFTHYEYVFKFPVEDTVSLKFLLGKSDSEVPVGAHEIIIDNVICQVKNAPPAPQPAGLQVQSFEQGQEAWNSWWGDQWSGLGTGTVEVVDGFMVADLQTLGAASYAPQLFKEGIKLEKDKTYVVRFDAKADQARKMNVNIGKALSVDPWFRAYAPTEVVDLTTELQSFAYEFSVSEATDEQLKMVFELGTIVGNAIATKVYFDNVSIVEK